MEIKTQQMEALLHLQEQQAQLPRKNGAQVNNFETLLNQEIANSEPDKIPAGKNPALTGTALYNPVRLESDISAQAVDSDAAVLQAAFDQASGTLDLWDSYAKALGNTRSDDNLRGAWSILESIDNELGALRANPLAGKNAAYDDILNELEILSATEKFKFNRGDYLI